jgi:hypothetical protein
MDLTQGTIDHCGRGARAKKAQPSYIHGSYRQAVGLLGRGISLVASQLPTQYNTNLKVTPTDMHALCGIRNHDPSV